MNLSELSDATHKRITTLTDRGNVLAEAGDFEGALEAYREGLDLVPEPVSKWEASTWLFTAIGDVLFQQGKYLEARDALRAAMLGPDALGNPFIHLRLGESHFELGEHDRAKDELARAYMGGGDEVFDGEDPKYRNYIKEILRPREDI